MGTRSRPAAPSLALSLGLLFASPASIISTIAPLAAIAIGNLGFMSPASGEAALTKKQSDALNTYNNARSNFEQVLTQRRAQINSKQPLPNLPGQALYLARNAMMSAYKDLTDALPSKIGGPNKYGIPPAYFDAGNEALLDEYRKLFDIMQAPPANAQKSDTPFKDVVDLGTAIARAKGGSMRPMPKRRAVSASGCSLPRQMAIRTSGMRARTNTRAVCKQAYPKIKMGKGNGPQSKNR